MFTNYSIISKKTGRQYDKFFCSDTDARHWIINTLDLSLDWFAVKIYRNTCSDCGVKIGTKKRDDIGGLCSTCYRKTIPQQQGFARHYFHA